jgi:predicted DNA binding CopG/RHH family protein
MSKRSVPVMTTDEEAEAFLAEDLSDLDYRTFKPLRLTNELEAPPIEVRLPMTLARAIEARAAERGVSQEHLIREAIEKAVGP